jgi:acyl-CoA thioesterase
MKQDIRNPEISAQTRAERVAECMVARDKAARSLGIRLDRISPGAASMSMEVKSHHLNGHDICHGGIIFTLADTAFAFACNSHNQIVVAQHNTISFLKPVAEGETLTAEAQETSKDGRNGIYDVKVSIAAGDVVAHFRGCSRVIEGQHFDESKDS